jgi:hypothetical protein
VLEALGMSYPGTASPPAALPNNDINPQKIEDVKTSVRCAAVQHPFFYYYNFLSSTTIIFLTYLPT